MAFSVNTNEHLIRSNLWSAKIKEVLEDDLRGMQYVDMITDFPDGNTLNIPSIGQAHVHNFAEGQKAVYNSMDTGNFTFSITSYLQTGMYITEQMKQDSFYTGRLVSSFVPKMHRAIAVRMETDIMDIGVTGQTVSNANSINGQSHRWVAGGTNNIITLQDFAKAKLSLRKANVPLTNLVAIIDPVSEYILDTQTNLVNVSNNPQFEGIVNTGMSTGMKFFKNIYGFDVYTSNYLKSGISETVSSRSVTNGVANIFFSAAPDVCPFVGNVRQPPKVDSEYNKDEQREEYVVTCRYGFGFYRPENFVCVLTDQTALS